MPTCRSQDPISAHQLRHHSKNRSSKPLKWCAIPTMRTEPFTKHGCDLNRRSHLLETLGAVQITLDFICTLEFHRPVLRFRAAFPFITPTLIRSTCTKAFSTARLPTGQHLPACMA